MPLILLIEDDLSLLKMYKDKFEHEGFEIISATNGASGLKLALDQHPDLILLDILMPEANGLTVMEKLRKDSWGKDVSIIILTNLDTNDAILNSVSKFKPAYYLIKSNVTPEGVVQKIREVLKLHQAK